MTDTPNVLILIWDAVRAKNTSLHGYDRDTTPFLHSLVEERAVNYEQARATSSWTLPSHVSIMSGLYPHEHQANSKSEKCDLGDRNLAVQLGNKGYRTSLITNNTYLRAPEFGFSRPFDTVLSDALVSSRGTTIVDPEIHAKVHGPESYVKFLKESLRSSSPMKSILQGASHKISQTQVGSLLTGRIEDCDQDDGAGPYVDSFLEWVDSEEGPFFGLINYLETHAPYCPPPGYRDYVTNEDFRSLDQTPPWAFYSGRYPPESLGDLQDLYDGCIRYLDDVTKRLVNLLEERGVFKDTLLIVAGDHGDGFGESGTFREHCIGHIGGIEESLLHVPLIVKFPEGRYGGQTVSDVVSLKDVYATVSEVTTVNLRKSDHSRDLRPDTAFPQGVLSQRHGITKGQWAGITEENSSLRTETKLSGEDFDQNLVAYYENGLNSTIHKYAFSVEEDREVVESINEEKKITVSGSEYPDWVVEFKRRGRDFFANLEPVFSPDKANPKFSSGTKEQLENLGYM